MNANRGMFLETIINRTIEYYSSKGIACLFKRNLPIKIYSFTGNHVKGWVNSKTETDYYGVFKGRYFDFEAKQTKGNSLPLVNIKSHQIKHMENVVKFGAITFFITYFQDYEKFYLLKFNDFLKFINSSKQKSIPINFFESKGFLLELIYPGILDLEEILDKLTLEKAKF
ncbi:Holliday junction resolvase RecU [Mycoplasmoides alvi]|uniref:Holliday junction resolvase RecU n=1 Tax=Mycoplasmoides alvi TaxID=78580 RepID=UPI00069808F4|nr:Holliday junction resolvase RecU [Mycoplasmoides alvi]